MVKMHALAPSLTPRGGSRNGRSGKLSHSSDVIGACICSNDVNVCGSAHCGCVVNGSVAMAAF